MDYLLSREFMRTSRVITRLARSVPLFCRIYKAIFISTKRQLEEEMGLGPPYTDVDCTTILLMRTEHLGFTTGVFYVITDVS